VKSSLSLIGKYALTKETMQLGLLLETGRRKKSKVLKKTPPETVENVGSRINNRWLAKRWKHGTRRLSRTFDHFNKRGDLRKEGGYEEEGGIKGQFECQGAEDLKRGGGGEKSPRGNKRQ